MFRYTVRALVKFSHTLGNVCLHDALLLQLVYPKYNKLTPYNTLIPWVMQAYADEAELSGSSNEGAS